LGKKRNSHGVLVGKPELKTSLERPRRREEDNIKPDLQKIGWKGEDCNALTQDMDSVPCSYIVSK
jgi:hypothetical protein